MWLVVGIPNEELESLWETMEPMVRKALENGGSLEESSTVFGAVRDNVMQMWGIMRNDQLTGIGITEIEERDKGTTLTVVALSGIAMEEWLEDFERTMRVFGAAKGCKYLTLHGRRGWLKTLREFNWKEISVTMYKEL